MKARPETVGLFLGARTVSGPVGLRGSRRLRRGLPNCERFQTGPCRRLLAEREGRMSGGAVVPATAALLVLCMGLWATTLLPEIVTALAFFGLAMLLRLGTAATVFSGFSASAFWLVLSGMVVGQWHDPHGPRRPHGRRAGGTPVRLLRAIHCRPCDPELPDRVRDAVQPRPDRPDDPGDARALRQLRAGAGPAGTDRRGPGGRRRDADPVGGDPARQRSESRDGRLRREGARPAPLLPVLLRPSRAGPWRW